MRNKIGVKWTSAFMDSSGYATAARNYVGALIDSGAVDLTLKTVSFEKHYTTHGSLQKKIERYLNKDIPYNIQVIHLTPENYPPLIEKNKYNVAYTTWETDKLPDFWVPLCNKVNELWVPSQWNKEVFESSGVNKPIYVIPHGINAGEGKISPLSMGVDDDVFIFYSIFQWIERKAPLSLLKAYLTEFKPNEKVCLALKTYRLSTSPQEQNIIKQDISNVKKSLNLKKYPEVRFFGVLLSAEHMRGFHDRGDCFVLPSRGEGFSLGHAEAMSYGKPVIGTRYGGCLDFMNDKNSYLVDYQLSPVHNMIFPNYHGDMTWADPSIVHLRELMRHVFENREEAREKGEIARNHIEENFGWNNAASLIIDRLTKIQKEL